MSLHLTKSAADTEASRRIIDAGKRGHTVGKSSGSVYLRYAVQKRFGFLWEVYEPAPHSRPRA